ncbi:MAG: sodium-dependent transporter, partial [Deltaproteobacteria bacterium]|nr:sodium-dependent transporter [Deltaproteobacteria bacterium]
MTAPGEKARGSWSGTIGFVLAAIGSAVGLGNVWRFPYITGKYGGSAFVIVYIGCVLIVGLPIMLAEFLIGRRTQRNIVGAFRGLRPASPWVITG